MNQRRRIGGAGEDEVVRGRAEGRDGSSAAVLHHEELEGVVDRWVVAECPREAEQEVVASLVAEQERPRAAEELVRGREALDTHPTMV